MIWVVVICRVDSRFAVIRRDAMKPSPPTMAEIANQGVAEDFLERTEMVGRIRSLEADVNGWVSRDGRSLRSIRQSLHCARWAPMRVSASEGKTDSACARSMARGGHAETSPVLRPTFFSISSKSVICGDLTR